MIRRFLAFFLSFVFAFVVLIEPAAIAVGSAYYLPTLSADNPTPDWANTTFGSFPALDGSSTAILEDPNLLNALGYNPSRSWEPGASLMNVLKVGDLYNFGLGNQAIINFLGGSDPSKVALGSFSALNAVSLNDLVKTIPGLSNLPASALPIASSLFSGNWSSLPNEAIKTASNYFPEINQFLSSNPALSSLPIGQIIQGNWSGALSAGASAGLKALTGIAPQLGNLPLGSIVSSLSSGNIQGALSAGLNYGVSRLVGAFPELNGLPIGSVLGGITSGNWNGALNAGLAYGSKFLVSDLTKMFPELSNVPLGTVLNLNNFSLSSVPGLAETAISKIPGIANQSIGSIPGLGNVPVSTILDLASLLNMEFAKVDFLDQAAKKAEFTLSGSTKGDQFKPEPCVGNCPHFEVHDSKTVPGVTVNGRQWVTGDQKVPGGKGALGIMNGGKEPTGLVPWGFKPNLKLVVSKVHDAQGKIDLALYTRVCYKTLFVDLGCTPFFIGPIPFGSVSEKGLVVIATSAPPPEIPSGYGIGNILGPDCVGGSGTPPDKFGYKAHKEASPSDLVPVPTPPGLGRTEQLQKDAAAAFEKMRQAAAQQGIDLTVVSGYRSVATQQALWDDQVAKQGSEAAAAKISAPPGYSEHMTGYAMDVSGQGGADLTQSFQNTATYAWLAQNAKNYGFQQSYTTTSTGGADNEPWHWRFVGTATAQAEFAPSSSTNTAAIGNQNLVQYLARLSIGESSNNTNIGPNPQTGAYGEYQFTAETRATVLNSTGLDPWSTDKATRDKATLAWIDIYGQEKRVDLIGAIKSGNFALADQVLGKNQFTSLPGGSQHSAVWENVSNLQKYGPVGNGGGGCVLASATAVPCPPGQTCLLLNPNKAGYIPSYRGIFHAQRPGRLHEGVDLQSPKGAQNWQRGPGETILAAAAGVVEEYVPVGGRCGGVVGLSHPDRNLETRYLHMVQTFVRKGESVQRGQAIGVEGNETPEGCGTTGTHLHYEVYLEGKTVNPVKVPHEPPLPATALDGTAA